VGGGRCQRFHGRRYNDIRDCLQVTFGARSPLNATRWTGYCPMTMPRRGWRPGCRRRRRCRGRRRSVALSGCRAWTAPRGSHGSRSRWGAKRPDESLTSMRFTFTRTPSKVWPARARPRGPCSRRQCPSTPGSPGHHLRPRSRALGIGQFGHVGGCGLSNHCYQTFFPDAIRSGKNGA
jgi:hypothetical protein